MQQNTVGTPNTKQMLLPEFISSERRMKRPSGSMTKEYIEISDDESDTGNNPSEYEADDQVSLITCIIQLICIN